MGEERWLIMFFFPGKELGFGVFQYLRFLDYIDGAQYENLSRTHPHTVSYTHTAEGAASPTRITNTRNRLHGLTHVEPSCGAVPSELVHVISGVEVSVCFLWRNDILSG